MNKEIKDVWVYSQLLKKPFATLGELKEAEDVYTKEHAAEIKAKEDRKAEAEKVKALIKVRAETEMNADKVKIDAYKRYLEVCDEADKKVYTSRQAEREALTAFCEKYPEGFHDTIQIGDVTYRYNYSKTFPATAFYSSFMRILNNTIDI